MKNISEAVQPPVAVACHLIRVAASVLAGKRMVVVLKRFQARLTVGIIYGKPIFMSSVSLNYPDIKPETI